MYQEQQKPVVLVVDDQATMRFFANQVLTHAGFNVLEANNGSKALAAFTAKRPDFVLLDVIMPEMDGFAACKAIRTLPDGAHVPVLMMTSQGDEHAIKRAYDAGATDFIDKPISRIVLPHRVRYMLHAKQTADRLRASESHLVAAQQLAKLGSWQWQASSNIAHCSDVCCQILGLPTAQIKGNYCELFRNIPTHEKRKIIEAVETAAATGKMVSVEHQLFPAQGPELYISHTIQVIGSNGYIHRLNGTVQDITDRKKADARIRSLAYVDQLTGLANRVFLKEYLKSSLAQARRKQESLALLYLDLDDFKHVNDTLGHSAGDTLLREVAKRLKYCTRDADTLVRDRASLHTAILGETLGNSIARLGGDEFISVLNSIEHMDNVLQVAQRITEALAQPFEIDQQAVRVTSSIGISLFPNDGEDEETLFKNADMAMYHAKGTGKNNFQFFTARINQTIVNRLTLERNLRTALDRDQLFLQYQPKFDLASGQISGLEALLRWRHPTRGIVGPADFITFAEECGFIVPIGEWVIHTVCQQQRAWQDAGLPAVRIALNLSVRQIRDHNLLASIQHSLAETGIAPQQLELEITETVFTADSDRNLIILQQLNSMGVLISLDDFGAGYSSLSYLKRFPIDILKIDRSLIQDLCTNSDSQAITAAIISMAHKLGLRVVAEGVETQQQLTYLRNYSCDEMQGYLFSQPVPAAAVPALLEQQHWNPGLASDYSSTALAKHL